MGHHARLSPSNHRWPHCPGSVREEAQYPDVAGEAAIDGTGSHLLLELCLTEMVAPEFYEGRIIGVNHEDKPEGWLVSEDRIERVWMALNYISRRQAELREQFPGTETVVEAESKSNPGKMFGRDDWYGTCDVTIMVMQGDQCLFLEVMDYKDGRGWVNAADNSQLISYAGGKAAPYITSNGVRPFRPERIPHGIRTTIVQPKTTPPVRYHDYTTGEVISQLEDLSWKAQQTVFKDAPLVSGKHCQWCKHKPNCNAQSEKSLEVLKMSNTDVVAQNGASLFELVENVISDVESMNTDRLVELADAEAGIQAAFDRVKAELTARLEQGQQVDGYALKPGRSSRIWNESEDEIAKMLKARRLKRDDIYPPKLISVAQLLKHPELTDDQKAKIESKYVTVKAGELKLAKVARGKKSELPFKDVVQSATNELPSFL